ncbi:MAG TPA: hypothetical protein VHK65_07985 [Candidatus Dormibacteraeota bacterium]|nr:hypothetical protein [Candidatus Dormibacteraeota bacterium]
MRVRLGWVAAILVLVAVQCLFWFVAAEIAWAVRHFLTSDPQVIAERTRAAVAWFVWCGVNFAGLLAFAIRRHRISFWLVAAIQVANLGIAVWIGFQQVSQTCGDHGLEWLIPIGLAAVTLLVMYGAWRRRGDHTGPAGKSRRRLRRIVQPAALAVWIAAGLGLLGLGWHLGIQGIQLQSGVIATVRDEPGAGLHLTLDASSRDIAFLLDIYDTPPDARVGDRVAILTMEACDYGFPLAVQSQRGIWIDSTRGDLVQPFTPNTWWLHELFRWLALSAGVLLSASGLVAIIRWIGPR